MAAANVSMVGLRQSKTVLSNTARRGVPESKMLHGFMWLHGTLAKGVVNPHIAGYKRSSKPAIGHSRRYEVEKILRCHESL